MFAQCLYVNFVRVLAQALRKGRFGCNFDEPRLKHLQTMLNVRGICREMRRSMIESLYDVSNWRTSELSRQPRGGTQPRSTERTDQMKGSAHR